MGDIEEQRRVWRREFEDLGKATVEHNLREPKEGWWGTKGDEAEKWLRERLSKTASEELAELRIDEQLSLGRRSLKLTQWRLALGALVALLALWSFCSGS